MTSCPLRWTDHLDQTRSCRKIKWTEGDGWEIWSDLTVDVICGEWGGKRRRKRGWFGRWGPEHLGGWWCHLWRWETQAEEQVWGQMSFLGDLRSSPSWQPLSEERLTRQMEEQVCRRPNTLHTASPSMFIKYEINKAETSFHVSVPTALFTGWVLAEVRLEYIQLKNNCLPLLCPPICCSFQLLVQLKIIKIWGGEHHLNTLTSLP